jgi:hypothetical protein
VQIEIEIFSSKTKQLLDKYSQAFSPYDPRMENVNAGLFIFHKI